MRMEAFGILDALWKPHSGRDPTHCLRMMQSLLNPTNKKKDNKTRLTLNGLSGAFVVLGLGYLVSILAFIIEHIVARRNKRIAKVEPKVTVTIEADIHHSKIEEQSSSVISLSETVKETSVKLGTAETSNVKPIVAVDIAKKEPVKLADAVRNPNDIQTVVTVEADNRLIKNQPNKEGVELMKDDKSQQVQNRTQPTAAINFDLMIEEILED